MQEQESNTDIRLLTVCSKTKGAGKTWFSVALCEALAKCGKKVLFFDESGGAENAAWQLGLTKSSSYTHLISGRETLATAVDFFNKGRFDIITSPSGENAISKAPLGRVCLLAEDLRLFAKYYDIVVVDTGCLNEKADRLFIRQSTDVILLTTPDSSALVEAYKELEFLKTSCAVPVGVVINKVYFTNDAKQIYKTVIEEAAKRIGIETFLSGGISRDARVKESVISRALVSERYPECESTLDVMSIAKKICGEQ